MTDYYPSSVPKFAATMSDANLKKNFLSIQAAEQMQRFTNQEHLKTIDAKRYDGGQLDLANNGVNWPVKGATMHDGDLFKIAVRNLSEQEIVSNFPKISQEHEGKGPKYAALIVFHKVWQAYTKYLQSQVLHKGRTVVCPVFGTFVPAASYI